MTEGQLQEIFDKTHGHCHFCGDPLSFSMRGKEGLKQKGAGWRKGYWEVDHVTQRDKGGQDSADNCLPACTGCNRLRWHRGGDYTRRSIFLGLIARREIKQKTEVGRELARLYDARRTSNRGRRKAAAEP